jgi:hypothetical protein
MKQMSGASPQRRARPSLAAQRHSREIARCRTPLLSSPSVAPLATPRQGLAQLEIGSICRIIEAALAARRAMQMSGSRVLDVTQRAE